MKKKPLTLLWAVLFTALASEHESLLFVGLHDDPDPIPKLLQIHTGSYRTVVIPLPETASGGRIQGVFPQGKRIFTTVALPDQKQGLYLYDLKPRKWKQLDVTHCPFVEKITTGNEKFELTCRPAKNQGTPFTRALGLDDESFVVAGVPEVKIPQLKTANGLMTASLEADTLDWDRLRIQVDGREHVLPAALPKLSKKPIPPHQLKK